MSEPENFTEDLNNLPEDVREIERLLASLTPRAAGINRDRVLFLAGQASAVASRTSRSNRAARWMWPSATVCSACVGVLAGIWIAAEYGAIKAPPQTIDVQASRAGTSSSNNSSSKLATPRFKTDPDKAVETKDAGTDRSETWLALRESQMAVEDPPIYGAGSQSESSMGYRELTRRWLNGSEREEL